MIRYLGNRYDLLMDCIAMRKIALKRKPYDGRFTASDLNANPQRMKGLANDELLKIVEKRCTYPARPYSYVVPDKVRERFAPDAD